MYCQQQRTRLKDTDWLFAGLAMKYKRLSRWSDRSTHRTAQPLQARSPVYYAPLSGPPLTGMMGVTITVGQQQGVRDRLRQRDMSFLHVEKPL
jgi:hypothetical protein